MAGRAHQRGHRPHHAFLAELERISRALRSASFPSTASSGWCSPRATEPTPCTLAAPARRGAPEGLAPQELVEATVWERCPQPRAEGDGARVMQLLRASAPPSSTVATPAGRSRSRSRGAARGDLPRPIGDASGFGITGQRRHGVARGRHPIETPELSRDEPLKPGCSATGTSWRGSMRASGARARHDETWPCCGGSTASCLLPRLPPPSSRAAVGAGGIALAHAVVGSGVREASRSLAGLRPRAREDALRAS